MIVRGTDAKGNPADPLGSATIHGASVSGDGSSWTLATLDAPVDLAATRRYALTLTASGAHPFYVGAGLDSSYLDGTALTGLTDGSTFWNKLSADLAFRTYLQ